MGIFLKFTNIYLEINYILNDLKYVYGKIKSYMLGKQFLQFYTVSKVVCDWYGTSIIFLKQKIVYLFHFFPVTPAIFPFVEGSLIFIPVTTLKCWQQIWKLYVAVRKQY